MTSPVIDDAIQKAITTIETAAPKAWAMLVRAQVIDAELVLVTRGMWLLFFLAVFLGAPRSLAGWDVTVHNDEGLKRLTLLFLSATCAAFSIAMLCSIAGAVAALLNPDVYAAQALLHR